VLQYALATCEGDEITVQDLPDECLPRILARSRQAESEPEPESAAALRETLRRHRWNVSAAARELGVSRPTMYRRMRLLGIEAPI
ncbi:MAG TPA: sigma-54-dependent Fis family transcriptional regulator, partial [Pseudomonas sp.]|nr:sigma-54-dependent Fis family transcriptional regulator [Pseudomonas sp.]